MPQTTWEYCFELLDFSGKEGDIDESTKQLNELGMEGWEVVSLMPKMGH